MDKYDRIYRLHQIFSSRRTPIPVDDLMERLDGCSRATIYRDIAFLRDVLGAPLESEEQGYVYRPLADGRAWELPGLWFSAAELQALATFRQLLQNLGGGLLEEHLAPLSKRLEELISHRRLRIDELPKRVRLLGSVARPPGESFHGVAAGVLQRRRLEFRYHSRSRDQKTERHVSPQRLVHYRDNWYLDAYDHGRKALRIFSLDRIGQARVLDEEAKDVDDAELDRHYASAFGIFAGPANRTAVLRFTPERARWVADERWHPQQSGQYLTDGSYELRIPYHDPRELVMEILRHGASVEVVEPEGLREEVRGELERAVGRYGG